MTCEKKVFTKSMCCDKPTGQQKEQFTEETSAVKNEKDEASLEIQWAAYQYIKMKKKQEEDAINNKM